MFQTCINIRYKYKIFGRMSVTEQISDTMVQKIDTILSQWCPRSVCLVTFFQISAFVFSRTKKFLKVLNNLRVSKLWQKCCFYPFNILLYFLLRAIYLHTAIKSIHYLVNFVIVWLSNKNITKQDIYIQHIKTHPFVYNTSYWQFSLFP